MAKKSKCSCKGDLVSVSLEVFDGDIPGQYSHYHPDRCYGVISKGSDDSGVCEVIWVGDDEECSSVAEAREWINKESEPVDRLKSQVHLTDLT